MERNMKTSNKNLKIFPILLFVILTGCSTEPATTTIEKKEPTKNIEPQLKRSSSMAEIEHKIIMDLKNIGKSDTEIADYLVEWRKQNSQLIK